MIALIDADIVCYQAASMAEGKDPFDGTPRKDISLSDAWQQVVDAVDEILAGCGCDSFMMVLSPDDRSNFRKTVFPAYKANRNPKPKPTLYWPLIEKCREQLEGFSLGGMEGDDLLGILHTENPDTTVIVSSDKDMLTIPGRVYNPRHGEIVDVTLNQANYNWLTQTLTGDTTDGYGGCPRVGKVKAAKALLPPDDTHPEFYLRRNWQIVIDVYRNHYGSVDDAENNALCQARLARILRSEDYDPDDGLVRLWHPTVPTYLPVEQL